MGYLEKESKKRTRNANLQRIILGTVAAAGVISFSLLAPNAMRVFKLFGLDKGNKRQKEIINASRGRLVKAGLLARDKGGLLRITAKGERKLEQLEMKGFKLKKPKKWDKKWRVVIFDISEKKRQVRDRLRVTLASVGFIKIQNSVWAYPHDCEDFVALLKVDFNMGREILYMIVDAIEGDWRLRRHFKLL